MGAAKSLGTYVYVCTYVWYAQICVERFIFYTSLIIISTAPPSPHGALNFSSLVSLYLLFGFVLNCCVNQANHLRGQSL